MPIISNFPTDGYHAGRVDNPHVVTKSQIGLANVDNTADKDKPVSSVQATAIADAKKEGTTAFNYARNHVQNQANPHGVTAAQVGAATNAALNAHTGNRSNPHGVTAAQAGAAPAGYVLSTLTVGTDAELDQAIRQIINEQSFAEHSIRFYYLKCTTTSLALGGGYWLLELNKMSVNYGTAVARSYVGSGGVREMKRVWSGAILQPWEWDNPPMSAGVEYRTTQRYLDKPVYTKLVNLGTLPGIAGGKRINHGAATSQIIRVTGASSDGHAIPYRYGPESPMIWIGATETQVVVVTANRSDSDYSKLTGTAQIWYTKQGGIA